MTTSIRYVHGDDDEHCVLGVLCFRGEGESSFEYQGKRVHVYRGPNTGAPLHVDVVVNIPAGLHARFVNEAGLLAASGLANPLTLNTAGGDVYASKSVGKVTADTEGGELRVDDLKGNLSADTDGGDAYVSRSTGDVHLATGGGDGHLRQLAGSLDVNTGGGDLYVKRFTSGVDVSLHTGGGDLHFSGELSAARNLDVATGGGDGILKLSGLSMHLDIVSGGGDVSVHLPGASNVHSSDSRYSADVGKAQGRATIMAGGGDITVEKSE